MTEDDLTDELNPQHELASAYLDGVASPADRAQVEASPELLSLVASFAAVRARLADVPPVSSAARASAFAAAFAEFDVPDLSLAAAGASVIPSSSKRTWARPLLSVAAALLLVGVVGIAAKGSFSGNNSKSSSASQESNEKGAAPGAATEAKMTSDTMAAMAPPTIGYIGGSAQAPVVIENPEQLLALATATLDDTAATTVGSPATTAAIVAGANTVPPSTSAEFAPYARGALACLTAQQVFVADIQYQGIFAIAVRDTVTGMISAIADDCTVLATVGS